jgi:hypothetical protein
LIDEADDVADCGQGVSSGGSGSACAELSDGGLDAFTGAMTELLGYLCGIFDGRQIFRGNKADPEVLIRYLGLVGECLRYGLLDGGIDFRERDVVLGHRIHLDAIDLGITFAARVGDGADSGDKNRPIALYVKLKLESRLAR